MKIKVFKELFADSKKFDKKHVVITNYKKLINEIASTRRYPEWFNHISLNMMICGLRKAGFKFNSNNAKTFEIIWVILSDWLPNYGAQEIANSLLALDQMGLRWSNFDAGLQADLMDSVRSNVGNFNAQQIANSLLALNQMGLCWSNFDADLRAQLLDSVGMNVERFNAQGISNSLLSLDQMGLRWRDFDEGLQDSLMASVRSNVGNFNAQGIANSLLALDQMGLRWVHFDSGLRAKLLESVGMNVERFNAQGIVNSLLALDQMGLRWRDFDEGLQDSLMASVRSNVGNFNAQGIANSLLALDQMGLRWSNFDADLRAQLLDSVRSNAGKFNEQEIANSLLALDQMGLKWHNFSEGLRAKLINSVRSNVGNFNAQDIANSLLALTRLHIDNDEILKLLINQISRLDSFSSINARQILLALTWIKAYRGKAFIELENRFEPINEIADSRLHQDVIRIINKCNIPVEKEKRVGVKGVISLDCYILSKNLVIEVHGPSHYSADGSLNVKSEKQAELIKKLGFKYQVISYKDWDALKDDDAKKAYIRQLMPNQLNASARVFRSRNYLDPNAIVFKPIGKIRTT